MGTKRERVGGKCRLKWKRSLLHRVLCLWELMPGAWVGMESGGGVAW